MSIDRYSTARPQIEKVCQDMWRASQFDAVMLVLYLNNTAHSKGMDLVMLSICLCQNADSKIGIS